MPLSVITKNDFIPRTAAQAAKKFAKKASLSSEAFDSLSNEARRQAFRIAGVHKVRLVQRARDVVHRAIRDGWGMDRVQRELLSLFDTKGIPPPALYRLRFVFQQNSQQAYNDARREALDEPEMGKMFPYRQYMTVGNGTPGVRGVRPTHAALHGLVFKWDDPFWDSHTPPWEYGCRCFFHGLTKKQVRRMGVKITGGDYVRKRIRVRGQKGRGIKPDPRFTRGAFDVKGVDAELQKVIEEMMGKG